MADSRDITGKNRKFTGTDSIVLPRGSEAQRVNTEGGQIRFNTDTNLAEYYDGTEWKPIDAPPSITGVSPASPVDDGSTVTEITITGSNLQSGGTLTIIGNDATTYNVSSFTRVSSSSITFNYTSALAAAGVNTPYDIKYENPSGLSATLEDGFTPNTGPVWVSPAAGASLGTIDVGANASTLTQISVTDTSGGTLVYSVISGALPSGASINSATGAISGVVDTAETATFTIQVTDGTTAIDRQFTATVVNPFVTATGGTVTESGDFKIHTFTGDGCFVVSNAGTPGGSTQVDYLVAAGGGGGGFCVGGGGGAGGYRESHSTPVSGCYTASPLATPTGITVSATTYPVIVGSGGTPGTPGTPGGNGNNSVFSTITSTGGGGGGTYNSPVLNGANGGSGGGGAGWNNPNPKPGGSGNTPPVSPPQGNPGGNGPSSNQTSAGGGGGGAAGSGSNTPPSTSPSGPAAPGGAGTASSITGSPITRSAGGQGSNDNTPTPGTAGAANSGDGGFGAGSPTPAFGGNGATGGSGIVIIRYKFQ